ncbi:unnamed protein product, partial [Dibothriocephalus latus]
MAPIREGRTAIIQLDPSSAITYDVLRFWKLMLSNTSGLGAAGQSLFIMTALPTSSGYDSTAFILYSKEEVKNEGEAKEEVVVVVDDEEEEEKEEEEEEEE